MKKIILLLPVLLTCVLLSTCAAIRADPLRNYSADMRAAASEGNISAGRAAARARNVLIDRGLLEEAEIDFDELYLLSRFITLQAESFRPGEEYMLCVGELVLNRMASPEFPDSMEEVIEGEGLCLQTQHCGLDSLLPSGSAVDIAMRLLSGERMLKSSVVYQCREKRPTVYASFCDRVLGFTYFCESDRPELYSDTLPQEPAAEVLRQLPPNVSLSSEALTELKDSNIIVYALPAEP